MEKQKIKNTEWKLEKLSSLDEKQFKLDNSGVYVTITRRVVSDNGYNNLEIRLDLMTGDNPLRSFVGYNAIVIYKRLAEFLQNHSIKCSEEHLMYIGYELSRAKYVPFFVQR